MAIPLNHYSATNIVGIVTLQMILSTMICIYTTVKPIYYRYVYFSKLSAKIRWMGMLSDVMNQWKYINYDDIKSVPVKCSKISRVFVAFFGC